LTRETFEKWIDFEKIVLILLFFFTQKDARKAAGIILSMIKEAKIAGRGILIAG
jgi:hypothetical protein